MTERRRESVWLADEAATVAYGMELAQRLSRGALVFLEGDLGAGKTTLVRGILRGLNHEGSVKSPTYTLLEPYALGGDARGGAPHITVYHFDFYRIGDSQELEFIGIDELMESEAVKLVEWPARGADRLPPPDVVIRLRTEGQGRRLELEDLS